MLTRDSSTVTYLLYDHKLSTVPYAYEPGLISDVIARLLIGGGS